MPRQARQASGTGIYHVMMRGINHQNIFEEQEDYYQFLNTLDMMALSYEPISDEVACLDIEDASKGRPSDDQVMMLIKEKTGATNRIVTFLKAVCVSVCAAEESEVMA